MEEFTHDTKNIITIERLNENIKSCVDTMIIYNKSLILRYLHHIELDGLTIKKQEFIQNIKLIVFNGNDGSKQKYAMHLYENVNQFDLNCINTFDECTVITTKSILYIFKCH